MKYTYKDLLRDTYLDIFRSLVRNVRNWREFVKDHLSQLVTIAEMVQWLLFLVGVGGFFFVNPTAVLMVLAFIWLVFVMLPLKYAEKREENE